MKNIYLKIQTIPTQNPAVIDRITQSIKPPANITNPDNIAQWYRLNLQTIAEGKYRRTAQNGLHGEIFSIAWAIDDGNVNVFWREENSTEQGLLQNFMAEMTQDFYRYVMWIGYEVQSDLRFLWQRYAIHNFKPAIEIPVNLNHNENDEPTPDAFSCSIGYTGIKAKTVSTVFDIQTAWTGTTQTTVTLADLSQAFNLAKLHESDFYDNWLAGHYQKIAENNRQAVDNIRALYRCMTFAA